MVYCLAAREPPPHPWLSSHPFPTATPLHASLPAVACVCLMSEDSARGENMADETFGELSGWGRHPVVRGRQRRSKDLEDSTDGAVLSRGLGRSYGDVLYGRRPDSR